MKSFRINFLSKLRIMLLTICIQILKNINISLILHEIIIIESLPKINLKFCIDHSRNVYI